MKLQREKLKFKSNRFNVLLKKSQIKRKKIQS